MIYVLSGGRSGATLVITGTAGDTCVISMGSKTYTKVFGTDKKVIFKGLATGTWTITMTNSSGQTATKTVTITADYPVTIAYFSATISITYPANSTCKIVNSSNVTVANDTNSSAEAKTWVVTVNAADTYTVVATSVDNGKTKSASVSISTDGQTENVTLTYELLLFDNGLIDGIAWDYVYNQNSFASSNISDVINMRSQTLDISGVRTSPRAYRGISEAIDLSDYSILKIRTKACASNAGKAYFQIGTSLSGSNLGQVAIAKETGQTTSIDVSAINQSVFIMMQVFGSDDYGNTIDISFDKVWAE